METETGRKVRQGMGLLNKIYSKTEEARAREKIRPLVESRMMRDILLEIGQRGTEQLDPQSVPLDENAPTGPTNPYGRSKWMVEFMLRDLAAAEPDWGIAILRYFNPVGAHESGLIGEDPSDIPNNLMPFVAQVAVGRRPRLSVFGSDWPTHDGTGVRDYIHVVDLALGHVAALDRLYAHRGEFTVNLGTGKGYSVLEMVRAFEKASGRPVPYEFVPRRPGDIAECWADPARARALLGWQATRDIDTMCADAWRWQSGNPMGYRPDTAAA